MIAREVLETVRRGDLNDDMQQIADIIGMDAFINLLDSFQGNSVYFPKTALGNTLKRFIVANRRKYTPRELSSLTGLTEVYVYEILRDHRNDPRQEEMFE